MNAFFKPAFLFSNLLISLSLSQIASAQTNTNACTSQLNALKGVLIFNPGIEMVGGNRVLYHWYPVTGSDFFIRTDHWDGDALLVEGPLFLGPYDLVLPESQGVPLSEIPLCFALRILSITNDLTGNCAIAFAGTPGENYLIQAATNPIAPVFWTTLTNNTDGGNNFVADAGGRWAHTDLNAAKYSARFYRAVHP